MAVRSLEAGLAFRADAGVRICVPYSSDSGFAHVIEHRFGEVNEAPPNKWMQLTVKSVTPFARRRAKGAPLSPAADPGR